MKSAIPAQREHLSATGGLASAIAAFAQSDGDYPTAIPALSLHRRIIGGRLDILVANAGIAKAAPIADTTVEDFDALFAVNVRAPYSRAAVVACHV